MTFLLIALGLWTLCAFFTWALCRTSARASMPVDEEGRDEQARRTPTGLAATHVVVDCDEPMQHHRDLMGPDHHPRCHHYEWGPCTCAQLVDEEGRR